MELKNPKTSLFSGSAKRLATLRLVALAALILSALCAGCSGHKEAKPVVDHTATLAELSRLFEGDAVVRGPELVDCRLSGGTETSCFSLTLRPVPSGFVPGPWCPRNIADGPEKSGIWLHEGRVYDADGAFIEGLDDFYDDESWKMFDAKTGAIRVTDSQESCEAAARPDVDPKYTNYCVECQTSYMEAGATITYVIPLEPEPTPRRGRVGFSGVGVAFSGVRLDAPAPVDAILDAHTLAPFDDCGGHVNLHVGYHLHAVTDCLREVESGSGHAPMIGMAMDGYRLYARQDADGGAPEDLDACGGHDHSSCGVSLASGSVGQPRDKLSVEGLLSFRVPTLPSV